MYQEQANAGFFMRFKGTSIQIEKVLINDGLGISKVS